MTHSPEIHELAAALAKAQAVIAGAEKVGFNPHFKSKYADLSSVWEACRKALTANGLSVVQGTENGPDGGSVAVTTMLLHSSGQWMSSTLTMRPTKDDPQGFGSACTYARRYALAAMVGVAPEDDDGNAASAKASDSTTKASPAKVPDGYEDWAIDLDILAQDNIAAAREAFKQSKAEYRDYFTHVDKARYQKFKALSDKRVA
jgi:hypothetical protein